MTLVVQIWALVNQLFDRPQGCGHIRRSPFVLPLVVVVAINITCSSAIEGKLFQMVLRRFLWVVAPTLVPALPWNDSLVNGKCSSHFEMKSTKAATLFHQKFNLPETILCISSSDFVIWQVPIMTTVESIQQTFEASQRHDAANPLLVENSSSFPNQFATLNFDNAQVNTHGQKL